LGILLKIISYKSGVSYLVVYDYGIVFNDKEFVAEHCAVVIEIHAVYDLISFVITERSRTFVSADPADCTTSHDLLAFAEPV